MPAALDCVELTRRLIRCPSVTPAEGGALDLVQEILEPLGFTCHRLVFSEPGTAEVDNLYARLGGEGANFCYAGHSDVVPVGETAAWSVDPFSGELRDGWVYGRGAVDMKGSIAAFLAALAAFLERRGPGFGGSISLLITGDEEAEAVNGTRKVLQWLDERGERLDACLVGEPTSDERLGDTIKIGRRGSLNGRLTVRGIQGHTAYPQLADNPLHHLVHMLKAVLAEPLDHGSEHFPPSTLQLTTIDVGNPASNVIPGQVRAAFNVRFNDLHTSDSLVDWLRDRLDRKGADYDLEIAVSGESFLCPPGPLSNLIARAVETVLGAKPELGTTGGTSDARFIKDYAPVAEFGLLNATAHKVDERVSVADLRQLSNIYCAVLDGTFPP
jgi:succinyl-diaminopimelate desuccinylase